MRQINWQSFWCGVASAVAAVTIVLGLGFAFFWHCMGEFSPH